MRIPLLCLLLLCLARPLAAQGPRVTRFETAAIFPIPALSAAGLNLTRAWASDSLPRRRTYWLEGGVVGGVLLGLVGTQFCGQGTSRPGLGCYVPAFAFIGGVVGFPLGALIGHQFVKR